MKVSSTDICYHIIIHFNLWITNIQLLLVVPVIKDKPKIIKLIKKKTVVIECTVISKFEPICTWYKEDKLIKESSRHQVHIEKNKEGEYTVKLEIHQCNDNDRGSYKMMARNERGEAVSQVVELIDVPSGDEDVKKPNKPQITTKLQPEISVDDGKSIDLIIQLKEVDKNLKIIWYKNSQQIREDSQYQIDVEGKSIRLKINKTILENSGQYRVVVSNESGSDETSTKLIVRKKKSKFESQEDEEQEKKRLKMQVIKKFFKVVICYVCFI